MLCCCCGNFVFITARQRAFKKEKKPRVTTSTRCCYPDEKPSHMPLRVDDARSYFTTAFYSLQPIFIPLRESHQATYERHTCMNIRYPGQNPGKTRTRYIYIYQYRQKHNNCSDCNIITKRLLHLSPKSYGLLSILYLVYECMKTVIL